MTKRKLLKAILVTLAIMVLSIIGWEQVDGWLYDWYQGEPVTYIRDDVQPTTVEGIIDVRARSWLKGPEAYEYAKTQVTEDLVEELSKL